MQEERGQIKITGDDQDERKDQNEEMLFSGVYRGPRNQPKAKPVAFSKFKCFKKDVKESWLSKMQGDFIKEVAE